MSELIKKALPSISTNPPPSPKRTASKLSNEIKTPSSTAKKAKKVSRHPITPAKEVLKPEVSQEPTCSICLKTARQTPDMLMLNCKTCGFKIHAACYDNQHFSHKFADGWQCVECKVCEVCKSAEYKEDNQILMCNRCDRGYHQNCCKLKFRNIPKDDKPWFCEGCYNYLKEKKEKKKNKKRKQNEEKAPQQNGVSEKAVTTSTISTLATSTPATAPTTTPATTAVQPSSQPEPSQKINIFVVYRLDEKKIYATPLSINNIPLKDGKSNITPGRIVQIPKTDEMRDVAAQYNKELRELIFKRFTTKIDEIVNDPSCESDIRDLVTNKKFVIRCVSAKARDRFGSDTNLEVDRWFFEDYGLKEDDLICVDLNCIDVDGYPNPNNHLFAEKNKQ